MILLNKKMNLEQLEKIFLTSGSRHTISPFKREQIEKLLCINQFDDIFLMRTKYADSVCSLLQTKYEDIIRKYNNIRHDVPRTCHWDWYARSVGVKFQGAVHILRGGAKKSGIGGGKVPCKDGVDGLLDIMSRCFKEVGVPFDYCDVRLSPNNLPPYPVYITHPSYFHQCFLS